ncbi:hypothetical protein VNO77_04527 [Canavalia gladiata]|uniref:Uncharacterized protein n=1 Tax=Canavalia gladiata TaxID=3824 RepID=A0AAN9MXH3_CANGL
MQIEVTIASCVLASISFLDFSTNGYAAIPEVIEALAALFKSEDISTHIKPVDTVLAELPKSTSPMVLCVVDLASTL